MNYPQSEIRTYVKFRTLLNVKAVIIHQELQEICGAMVPHYNTIQSWAKRFREGRLSVDDDERSGRPLSSTTDVLIETVRQIVTSDPHATIEEISDEVHISVGSVHSILKDNLGMTKICSRWIPHLLTDAQKQERLETSMSLLQKMRSWSIAQWNSIATGDETWIRYFEPKRKASNKVWVTGDCLRPTMCKVSPSAGKVLYTIFVTNRGLLLQKPTPEGTTVTGNYYSQQILPSVLSSFKTSNPNSRLWLHHDNAPAHRSAVVMDFLQENNIRHLPHPPYSPDLAICDFYIFPKLKNHLAGKKYDGRSSLGAAIFQYLNHMPEQFYSDAFDEWKRRLQKCVHAAGNYFEQIT